ncbi:MAG: protein phosphatase 2A regulatory subunit cdc55 [Alyxoria varia]|nr:MAG: protein phosphatase 2A regulatory subunit cdc55 [Alyxoria varia]
MAFQPLLSSITTTKKPDSESRAGGTILGGVLIRDSFTITTWLAIGAAFQSLLILLPLRPVYTLGPAILLLTLKLVDNAFVILGWKRNPLMNGVLPGKHTALFPSENGQFQAKNGYPSREKIAVVLLGVRNNSPLGMLDSQFKRIGELFNGMIADLDQNPEEYGFLGSRTLLAAGARSTSNELINVMYFRSNDHIHEFAYEKTHRKGWDWWAKNASDLKHLSISHEIYESEAGHWENVFENYKPTGIAATSHPVTDEKGEKKWISPVVDGKGPLRGSHGRLGTFVANELQKCFGDKGDVEDITEGTPEPIPNSSVTPLPNFLSTDIISTVEFDQTGNYLATGDKGGRVVLFERNDTKKKTCEYKFHTEFQSHEPEFDYLKSLEIEEKINKIKWCRRQNASHYLLSTNDKTIKLWKVFEKSLKVVAENNLTQELTPGGPAGGGGAPVRNPNVHFRSASDLKLPRLTHHDTVVAAVPRKTYANAHAYHINSISVNSDGETFISSDDLRINLWNLNIQNESFNIVDIKPTNMEELTEVITAAEFHPQSCNWFMYASSKGTIKLADMRQKALCDDHAKQFEQEEDPANRSFFSEIISSISDVRFSNDGRYILSRDYLTVKIWDVNMENKPVKTIPIHEHLRPRLCDTYENDSIFDKFEVVFSGDAKNVMTGSYNNNFMIYPSDKDQETEVVLQADKSAFKAKKVGIPTAMNSTSPTTAAKKGGSRANSPAAGPGARMRKETDADQIDFNKKILHMSWHPYEDSIAIAATNNLFVFSAL